MKNQTISSEKVDIVEKSYANSDNIKKTIKTKNNVYYSNTFKDWKRD